MKPIAFDSPKNSWTRGRRRSQHTMTTRSPAVARATPRLARVVVLPSPASGLVTCRMRMGWLSPTNWMAVRSVR